MRKYYLLLFCAGAMLLAGCKKDKKDDTTPPVLDFFTFQTNDATVAEGAEVEIAVYWSKTTPKSGTVKLAIGTDTKFKAVEGTDFEIDTKELTFAENEYVKTVKVTATQNTTWQNDRSFYLEFESTDTDSYLGGTPAKPNKSRVLVTILDDDDSVFVGPFAYLGPSINGVKNIGVIESGVENGHFIYDLSLNSYTFDFIIDNSPEDIEEDIEYYADSYRVTIALPQEIDGQNDEKLVWVAVSQNEQSEWIPSFEPRYLYGKSSFETINFEFDFNRNGSYGFALARVDEDGEFIGFSEFETDKSIVFSDFFLFK